MSARLIVDAMNVIGSRPDGWWKDRRGAMVRLAESLRALPEEVTVVFDGRPWDGAPRDGSGLTVRWAPVADDVIAALASPGVEVVTSDAELATRARARGARVTGAGALRRRL